jgi:hypothetical protein
MDTRSKHKIHCATRASVQSLCRIDVAQSKPAPVKGFKIWFTVQKKVAHCTVKTRVNSGSPLCRNSLIYIGWPAHPAASQNIMNIQAEVMGL